MALNSSTTTSKKGRWWLLIFIIVVAAGGYWIKHQSEASESNASFAAAMRTPKTPVRIADAAQGVVEERLYAVGTVQAFNTVTVRSRVEGTLDKLYFKDGQFVQSGEVLALIDPRPFQAKLDQAQGQVKQTQAQLKQAQSELKRFETLEKQQSIATQQVENQRALVQQLQGALESAQAAVDDAKLQLNYTKITAPINGRLGLRNIDEGNLVSASNTDGLVVITQTQPIAVSFALPENDLQRLLERLQLEESLTVQVRDRQNKLLSVGSVLAVDNQINVNTGTIRVKASMPNLDNRLFPNQFVSVNVLLAQHQGIVIPSAAVQTGSIGNFVYVMDKEQKVHIQKVSVSLTTDNQSLIADGLKAGDKVVVEGTDRLREGSAVEAIPAPVLTQDSPQIATP